MSQISRLKWLAVVVSVCVLGISCGSSSKSTSASGPSTSSEPSASTTVSPQVAAGWATKWCQAQPGMTHEELIALMGPPTEPNYPTSDSWSAYEWMFNAFYGTDGRVRQLDINTIQLSSAQKASLQCDTTRKLP